jgi:hypothetical protein
MERIEREPRRSRRSRAVLWGLGLAGVVVVVGAAVATMILLTVAIASLAQGFS